VVVFPLFARLRRAIQRASPVGHCALTLLLSALSVGLLACVVAGEVVVMYVGALLALTFAVPGALVWGQRMKHEVRGPWDEARIQRRGSLTAVSTTFGPL
jgi:hypothetical protein